MLTRPFTRLVVAFGIRKITQRRLVEEFVTGTLILIPFGLLVGLITSRICTKIQLSVIRSDVWTTLVVFLIGDILMEWLLPSLGCLPVPAAAHPSAHESGGDHEVDEYVSSVFGSSKDLSSMSSSSSSFFRQDEFHYTITWLLQSYGLYCPADFANSDSLLTPDATAILFSIRLIFLCIGVHIGESIGCFVALTGGIATGKSTAAKMFVDYNYNNSESFDDDDSSNEGNEGDGIDSNTSHGSGGGNCNSNSNSNNNIRNRRNNNSSKKLNHKRGGSKNNNTKSRRINSNNNKNNDDDDDELMKLARANDDDGGLRYLFSTFILGSVGAFLSAIASFASTDDGSGIVYNEGTVQLICADSIAHNILLPPEVLAERAARASLGNNNSEGGDDDGGGDNDHHHHHHHRSDDDENDSGDDGDGSDMGRETGK